jgi:hypothetical protein
MHMVNLTQYTDEQIDAMNDEEINALFQALAASMTTEPVYSDKVHAERKAKGTLTLAAESDERQQVRDSMAAILAARASVNTREDKTAPVRTDLEFVPGLGLPVPETPGWSAPLLNAETAEVIKRERSSAPIDLTQSLLADTTAASMNIGAVAGNTPVQPLTDRVDDSYNATQRALYYALPDGSWDISTRQKFARALLDFLGGKGFNPKLPHGSDPVKVQHHLIKVARREGWTGALPDNWGVNMESDSIVSLNAESQADVDRNFIGTVLTGGNPLA